MRLVEARVAASFIITITFTIPFTSIITITSMIIIIITSFITVTITNYYYYYPVGLTFIFLNQLIVSHSTRKGLGRVGLGRRAAKYCDLYFNVELAKCRGSLFKR